MADRASTVSVPGGQDASGPVAVISGNGNLPLQVLEALDARSRAFRVVAIRGEAEDAVLRRADTVLGWGEVGRLYSFLRKNECRDVILIGGVTRRPDFTSVVGDLGTLKRLPKILKALVGGDDSLLTRVIGLFDAEGFEVVGIKDVAPELLAGEGVLGQVRPSKVAKADMELASDAASRLGDLDIGQGAVALNGRVISLEGAEGTDAMLERCADLRKSGRVRAKGRCGVLVKTVKPGQDLRVDLPTIGPRTVELAVAAGLEGIAVEAGGALIAEKSATLAAADQAGLFLFGFPSKHAERSGNA
ncbi:LpxI family protein [Roseibium sp.]|uniref:LpxI family protein n=1 Tax=Roseibium sp. TaxID=1936156 RepID=UPI003A97B991